MNLQIQVNRKEDITPIPVCYTSTPKPKPKDESSLQFGRIFTDHIFKMQYSCLKSWHNLKIEPYAPLTLDPSASGLHYGQSVWEGMKCYRSKQNIIQLFRPLDHFRRFVRSAERMVMPSIEPSRAVSILKQLIAVDKEWVPHAPLTSLYIRPIMLGTEPFLGVHPSEEYLFYIILCVVGQYYSGGLKPLRIYTESTLTRSSEGGTGGIKNSGNYAASLKAADDAQKRGFSQVLWLDSKEHRYIEEIGMMNIMFQIDGQIHTPTLNGSILPGITRDSVITLLRHRGFTVKERRISIEEIMTASRQGKLEEMFGTGTAAVIAPIGELQYKDQSVMMQNSKPGPTATMLYQEITGIQYGEKSDPFGWIDVVQ